MSTAQIALTAPDADGNPAGSQGRSWSFDDGPASDSSTAGKGFAWIVDGGRDARPSESDTYLTAMYEQYVNYRGPRRGTVDNPFAPVNVQTVVMTRPEGTQLDVRV